MDTVDLRLNRILLFIGLIVFLGWGFLYRITFNELQDPWSLRIGGALVIGLLLAGSYLSDHVKEEIHLYVCGLIFLFTLHESYLVFLNNVSAEFIIDYIVLVLIFNSYFRSPRILLFYMAYSVIMICGVYFMSAHPRINFGFIFSSVVTIEILVFPIFSGRMVMEEKLAYQAALMKSIYNDAVDAICLVNPDSLAVEDCNEAAERIFRLPKNEIHQKGLGNLLERQFLPTPEELNKIEDGNILRKEIILYPDESKPMFCEMALKKIRAGNIHFIFMRISDLSEEKRIRDDLAGQTKELERSNKELEQMAYVASHDLQEPLRTISSYVQLFARKYNNKIDAEANEYIHYVVEGSERMKDLINDLLTYSRVNSSPSNPEVIHLNKILQTIKNNHINIINTTHTEITWPENLPEFHGNEFEIMQLFQNLISNAIKFRTPDRDPLIKIGIEDEIFMGKKRKGWLFYVEDNGIGIGREYREKIFHLFQRLHTQDAFPGTGIGLAICKKVVEKYGGNIWVESQPGMGSKFIFSLFDSTSEG